MFKYAGTISHGTLRSQDLIEAFLPVLEDLSQVDYDNILENYPEYNSSIDDEYGDSEVALYMLEDLFDALDNASPEGYYFGSHLGNGSDFGFWELESDF